MTLQEAAIRTRRIPCVHDLCEMRLLHVNLSTTFAFALIAVLSDGRRDGLNLFHQGKEQHNVLWPRILQHAWDFLHRKLKKSSLT